MPFLTEGTLYLDFKRRGIYCWRDMNLAGQINNEAMRQGVKDSEVFILFLTNSALGGWVRYEIGWCLEFDRPVTSHVYASVNFLASANLTCTFLGL